MTLLLRPCGRGNWKPMRMRIDDARGALLVGVGDVLVLGGVRWRIASVRP